MLPAGAPFCRCCGLENCYIIDRQWIVSNKGYRHDLESLPVGRDTLGLAAATSRRCGLLGAEQDAFWRDHKSSKVNAIRTKTHLQDCDIAIIRFGEKFKQWNAAFDAGFCAAKGKPYITLHDEDIIHALKEVDAAAMAWAKTPGQVVEILKYVTRA